MESKIIKYKYWKTGEEMEHLLRDSYPHETITNLICPFDQTPLISAYNDYAQWKFCPNCGEIYSRNVSQEKINEQAKEHLLRDKKDLQELEQTRADLEARIKHAEEVGLIIFKE